FRHASLEPLALVGEGQRRALLVQSLGDGPGDRAAVRHAGDQRRLAVQKSHGAQRLAQRPRSRPSSPFSLSPSTPSMSGSTFSGFDSGGGGGAAGRGGGDGASGAGDGASAAAAAAGSAAGPPRAPPPRQAP